MPVDIPQQYIHDQVMLSLQEDIGSGDVTADLVPADQQIRAQVIARETAIFCGRTWFDEVFRQLDEKININWHVMDGDSLTAGQTVCELNGLARPILTGERTALNFIQTLSGTASTTHKYVEAIRGSQCRILDTRKTIPNLRLAQKYAVSCGGGMNHRIGLYDAILVKENHIASAGSISNAVEAARSLHPGLFLEVEVETLEQLYEAIECGVDRVLLDNMDPATLRKAVEINQSRLQLEASGGISLETIAEIASTGIDYISIGAITKHLNATDFSMRFI